MENVVLATRLQVFRDNLEAVNSVLETVRAHRARLDALTERQSEVRIQLGETRGALRTVVDLADAIEAAPGRANEEALESLQSALEEVEDAFKSSFKGAKGIGEELADLRQAEVDEDKLVEALETRLINRAAVLKTDLNGLTESLAAGTQTPNQIWQELTVKFEEAQQEVFPEYVDFLGGLALRESGFDGGMSHIADELMERCSRVAADWASLTIPARDEARGVTATAMIRLGFPEWTIWSLPLAAHEFGYLVAAITEVQEQVHKVLEPAGLEDHTETFIADAFATYAMGPAYVAAQVFFRFNPLSANVVSGISIDALRFEVVLRMLDKMSAGARTDMKQPYQWTINQLRKGWADALEDTQEPEAELESLRQAIDRCATHVYSYLANNSSVAYDPGRWERILGWSGCLQSGAVADIELDCKEELRDVLNAAWWCRLHLDDPSQAPHLKEAARDLWDRILTECRKEKTVPRNRPPRGRRDRSKGAI